MSDRKAGVVKSVSFVETTKSGWKKYDIVNDDGDAFRGLIPKDCNYPQPVEGDLLEWSKGQFGGYIIDQTKLPGQNGQSGSGGKSSKGGGRSGGGGSNEYWGNKTEYEQNVRDPKIEFQHYHTEVMAVYAAAIPTLETPPKTIDELDQYIDAAFDTAKRLYRRVQPKAESVAEEPVDVEKAVEADA